MKKQVYVLFMALFFLAQAHVACGSPDARLWVHNKTKKATINSWYLTVTNCSCTNCGQGGRYSDMWGSDLRPGQSSDVDQAHADSSSRPCFVMPLSLRISGGKYSGKDLQYGSNVSQYPNHLNVYVYDNYVDILVDEKTHFYSDVSGNAIAERPD